jgi:hypothetical protein
VRRALDALAIGPPAASPPVRLLVLLCLAGLAAVMLRAAWPKIADPHAFAVMVYRYQFLPESLVNATALLVPWLEVVCAATLLCLPPLRHAAAWMCGLLLLAFTALIASALARGITDIGCGCFSVHTNAAETIGWLNIARNLALLTLATIAAWGSRPQRAAQGFGDR